MEVDAETWRRFQVPLALATDVDELCGDLADATCQEAGMVLFTGATCDDIFSFSREGRMLQGIKAPLAGISRAAVNVLSKVSLLLTYTVDCRLSFALTPQQPSLILVVILRFVKSQTRSWVVLELAMTMTPHPRNAGSRVAAMERQQ